MLRRIFKFNVIFIALLYSITTATATGQPAVEDRPFTENDWHPLVCGVQRDVNWDCPWEREDVYGTFHPVKVNTEFVRQGTLPADVNVYLNDATEGTYRCSCRMNAEQTVPVLMKVIFFYSADRRFRNFPGNVTVEEGNLFNLTVCYLKHLPESVNLTTIALVEEATGNPTIVSLDRTNYCAQFPLQDPQPGAYHFKVTVHYGNINSRSFHIDVIQPTTGPTDNDETKPPTGATSYNATNGTTTAIAAVISIVALVLLLVVAACVIIGGCAWKRRREKSTEVHGAAADDPVIARDQGFDQQLQEADVEVEAIHDDNHQDVISECHVPIEETAPQENTTAYTEPTQVEDNSGGAVLAVVEIGLVREGQPPEGQVREPPIPPMQEEGHGQ